MERNFETVTFEITDIETLVTISAEPRAVYDWNFRNHPDLKSERCGWLHRKQKEVKTKGLLKNAIIAIEGGLTFIESRILLRSMDVVKAIEEMDSHKNCTGFGSVYTDDQDWSDGQLVYVDKYLQIDLYVADSYFDDLFLCLSKNFSNIRVELDVFLPVFRNIEEEDDNSDLDKILLDVESQYEQAFLNQIRIHHFTEKSDALM